MKRGIKVLAQKGVIAVELALMLPVLLLFFVVIIDLGIMLREHQVITNAAREAARFASLPKNDISTNSSAGTKIKQFVVNYCALEGVSLASSDVTINQDYDIPISGGQLKASQIVVQYNRSVLFLGGFGSAPQVTLRSSAAFSNLY